MNKSKSNPPLHGIKVLELEGLAPSPYCGFVLSDFGADVIRVDRLKSMKVAGDTLTRGKRSISLDLKNEKGKELFLKMCERSDVLIEPYRPGVMERLNLGPKEVLKRNPRIIYARLTGFGQTGYYKDRAGHDINYIAASGILSRLGRAGERPMFPCNILGDFAGGGLMCAFGILLALLERNNSGKGQVIDTAMTDSALYLSAFIFNHRRTPLWAGPTGTNLLDSGAPFYEVYRTKDDKFVSVGALEPQFYKRFITGLGLSMSDLPPQNDQESWPALRDKFTHLFALKTRDEWAEIFDEEDACVCPILEIEELQEHPHAKQRKLVLQGKYGPQVAPAPRLSRSPANPKIDSLPFIQAGQHTEEVLREMKFSSNYIEELKKEGVIHVIGGGKRRAAL